LSSHIHPQSLALIHLNYPPKIATSTVFEFWLTFSISFKA
jgi:hypothetical protein